MSTKLTDEEARQLLALAREAIEASLSRKNLQPDAAAFPEALHIPRAVFVTLYHDEQLRGCIGTLSADEPLIDAVARLAPAAARDRRFPPLQSNELPGLRIQLSVLSEPTPLECADDDDLARKLRPGIDGLILEEGTRRGTLLPQVWENLSDPHEFISVTKEKAGLPPNYTSPTLRALIYQSNCWSE